MQTYTVKVCTGSLSLGVTGSITASTVNRVSIKLVGTKGESDLTQLSSMLEAPANFSKGTNATFLVDCPVSLGELVLIELKKKALLVEDDWFPTKIDITSPDGVVYHFPIYQWISDGQPHLFREGTAMISFKDKLPLAKKCREEELKQRKKDYQWDVYEEGIPQCMKSDDPLHLPLEVRFSYTKSTQFAYTGAKSAAELNLKALVDSKDNWKNLDAIAKVKNTAVSDYVQEHWTEDAFFGYQYLNGLNPILIRRCTSLPDKFPVTNDMLRLPGGLTLKQEMKNGNIFLLDYKNLDGVKANTIDGEQQYLMAPLVLLHSTPDHKLMPVAIQLKQKPSSKDNPIFLPTDDDWLLAKIYVRSADFAEHELNVHLLRTHLLAEVFAVSLLRNVPMVHPLYKLLIPHTRYTLQINSLARGFLISENGLFKKHAASGGKATKTILQRSTALLTYSSLCPPDDIKERGMESVPGYYYRDDALRLWAIIHRFVEGILGYYYKTDADVKNDSELQKWIKDIFEHGFLSKASTGVPKRLSSVDELVKFATMVIFTGSAQHSAVNSGQFDYGGWMPNDPSTLRRPPPTTKGSSSESSSVLQTLPDVGTTANVMAALWLLSKQSTDFVALGHHPEEYFSEETPCDLMVKFRAELEGFTAEVYDRNRSLEVPYTYMDPKMIANSVAI